MVKKPQQLKLYTSLWAMMPYDHTGVILPYEQICEMVADAGYDGMAIDLGAGDVAQAHAVRPHMERHGLTPLIVAFPKTIESLHDTLLMAKDFGAPFVDVIGQVMHFAHHRWTQDWERDGELTRAVYTLPSYLIWMSGLSYWRNRFTGMIRRARGIIIEPYIGAVHEAKIIRESRLHLAGYTVIMAVSLYFQSWAAVSFWLLPMLLTKPIHQLQNTIEHLGLSHESDILNNTRSTRTNMIMRWLCWQMPYHTAHHSYPSVPFWQLRKLNDRIEDVVGPVHRMGWIEFQIEVIRKLAQKDESQWPTNEVWVVPAGNGKTVELEA